MKPILPALILAAALGACSKRDMCLSQANHELRRLEDLAQTTAGNIDRGYALAEHETYVQESRICEVPQPDGRVVNQVCTEPVRVTETRPVAIDVEAERAKLASLRDAIAGARSQAAAARAQCIATYPE